MNGARVIGARTRTDTAPRVLVTGAGGAAGVAVIRALRTHTGDASIGVIAADCDPHAAGLGLAQRWFVLPRADSPRFAPTLLERCRELAIDVIIVTVAEEIESVRAIETELAAVGTATWLPPAAAARACNDKLEFAQVLQRAGVATPATMDGTGTDAVRIAATLPGPWIVKPRAGRGSRHVYLADCTDDLSYALRRCPTPIVQTRVTGREFTVDALVGYDRSLLSATARWRLETKGGISTSAVTFHHPSVGALVERTLHALDYEGIACLQGFVTDDGHATCIEVNPRFGGGVSLSIAAGADLPWAVVRATLGELPAPETLIATAGFGMSRYFDEMFWNASDRSQACA